MRNARNGLSLIVALLAAAFAGPFTGCGHGSGKPATGTGGLTLSSPAFDHEGTIPGKYAYADDGGVSPPLEWKGVPAGAKSLLLVVDDPDANGFTHWVVYDIPPSAKGIAEGRPAGDELSDPAGARQGTNDGGGGYGWTGMDPPEGETHHYHFTLYALDTTLHTGPGPDKEKVLELSEGHVLGKVTLIATFRK